MKTALSAVIEELAKRYGIVKPELQYENLYQLTISVVLSAQTTDKQVNSVTPLLFKKYPSFSKLAKASKRDIETIIHAVGFFRTKAKNIISLASAITENYKGLVPQTIEELITLPGIGRKTANVVISQGHGKPGFAVDTHVKRLANRLGFTKSDNPDIIERELKKMIQPQRYLQAHLLLITHGRKTCLARRPLCADCVIVHLCTFPDKNL